VQKDKPDVKQMCSLRERDMRESPISEQNARADVKKMCSERESNFRAKCQSRCLLHRDTERERERERENESPYSNSI
jgi:hypothetical protein